MANKNPDNPTENVPLGENGKPFEVPAGQLSAADARTEAKKTLTNIMEYLAKKETDFHRVPGLEDVDNALSAIGFCRAHLETARSMVKGE